MELSEFTTKDYGLENESFYDDDDIEGEYIEFSSSDTDVAVSDNEDIVDNDGYGYGYEGNPYGDNPKVTIIKNDEYGYAYASTEQSSIINDDIESSSYNIPGKSLLESLGNQTTFENFTEFFQFVQRKNMAVSIERPSTKLSRSLRISGHLSTAAKMDRYVQSYLGQGMNLPIAQQQIISEGRNWNKEFQVLVELPDSRIKFLGLRNLAHDFVYAAVTYGKIIISEHCLPLSMKTIKPIDIGGIAGGLKFICQGILFKFAIDYSGIYGGDENAMKAASHELKGLTNYYHCGVNELHVPLMAYIDYRGFRLMALSLLPIDKQTLCYGSADAGNTVYNHNLQMNSIAKQIGKTLNLKKHPVGPSKTNIYGPGDIEGHEGKDGRLYMLDFARVAPPQPPKCKGEQLYKLFRMEFIMNYEYPLCSDGFSGLMSTDTRQQCNLELRKAMHKYTNEGL